jgi:transposase
VQRPRVRAFQVHIGRCTQCRRRVQGRHPLQTSDALGAAAAQLGPQATAFAVLLNKRCGLSYGKIAALLHDRFGLRVTCGGLVQAVHRAARQAQPAYDHLAATVRGSHVVTADLPTPNSAVGDVALPRESASGRGLELVLFGGSLPSSV